MNNEESERILQQSPWRRRAQQMQWFGLVMLCLAVGLAALTDLVGQRDGLLLIAIFFLPGVLALVLARVILIRPAGKVSP